MLEKSYKLPCKNKLPVGLLQPALGFHSSRTASSRESFAQHCSRSDNLKTPHLGKGGRCLGCEKKRFSVPSLRFDSRNIVFMHCAKSSSLSGTFYVSTSSSHQFDCCSPCLPFFENSRLPKTWQQVSQFTKRTSQLVLCPSTD